MSQNVTLENVHVIFKLTYRNATTLQLAVQPVVTELKHALVRVSMETWVILDVPRVNGSNKFHAALGSAIQALATSVTILTSAVPLVEAEHKSADGSVTMAPLANISSKDVTNTPVLHGKSAITLALVTNRVVVELRHVPELATMDSLETLVVQLSINTEFKFATTMHAPASRTVPITVSAAQHVEAARNNVIEPVNMATLAMSAVQQV